MYDIVKNKPVARFYYKGTHSSPVQRTVLLTNADDDLVTGYEIRVGNETVDLENAPIKSFRRDEIATVGQLRSDNVLRKKCKKNASTFVRMSMNQLGA